PPPGGPEAPPTFIPPLGAAEFELPHPNRDTNNASPVAFPFDIPRPPAENLYWHGACAIGRGQHSGNLERKLPRRPGQAGSDYGAAVRSAGSKQGALPGCASVEGSAQSMRVPLPMLKLMFALISVSARSRSLKALARFTMRVLNAVAVVPAV